MSYFPRWSCLILLAVSALVVGCDPAPSTPPTQTAAADSTFGSAGTVITLGKTKATEQFIARQWRVVSIGDKPIDDNLVLDLTDFRHGRGEFRDGCERISLILNTNDVSNERLLIEHSTRDKSDCESELIDDVMWMLSDVYAFERHGDGLSIIAMQKNMHLVPLK